LFIGSITVSKKPFHLDKPQKRKKAAVIVDRRLYEQQPPMGAVAFIRLWLVIAAQ
jgi:hypothetical protein